MPQTIKRLPIYFLPNMITATSLFFAFLAIKMTAEARFVPDMSGLFIYAAYAIVAAAVCDGLDGSVARWTHTQSAFGVQLDSLCDLVSFGIAPAFLMYQFSLHNLGRLGFAVCFVYCICGALRLARFNVQSSLGKSGGNFSGIPIPMAAMPLCVFVLAGQELNQWSEMLGYPSWLVNAAQWILTPKVTQWFLFASVCFLSMGMISTFEYVSTKRLRLPGKRPLRLFVAILITLVFLLSVEFTVTLAVLCILYCLHGPFMWLFLKRDKSNEEEEMFTSGIDQDGV